MQLGQPQLGFADRSLTLNSNDGYHVCTSCFRDVNTDSVVLVWLTRIWLVVFILQLVA